MRDKRIGGRYGAVQEGTTRAPAEAGREQEIEALATWIEGEVWRVTGVLSPEEIERITKELGAGLRRLMDGIDADL